MLPPQTLPTDMAEAAEERPTKRQRLTEELERSAAGRHVLETVSCAICTEVFEDPVSPRGSVHTYCRACIRQALARQPRCPLSNAQITIPRRGGVDAVLDGNHQVRSMINSQPVTCKYAPHGCTARPALESIDAHEATCPHKPIACSHERCLFVGSRAETAAHEKVCPFVLLGPVLDAQAAEIRSLQGEVRDAKRRLTAEHEASERLKARLEALEAQRPGDLAVVSPPAARRTRATRAGPAETDPTPVFQYPPGVAASDSIVVTRGDLRRLEPDEFLNDNLVDFYLKVIVADARRSPLGEDPAFGDLARDVHAFSSVAASELPL